MTDKQWTTKELTEMFGHDRIDQIAFLTGCYAERYDGKTNCYIIDDDKLAKFAEAIVGECIGVCLSQRDPSALNYKPSKTFSDALRSHFQKR